MFFNQVGAVVQAVSQFHPIGCEFPNQMDLFAHNLIGLVFYGRQEIMAAARAACIGHDAAHMNQCMPIAAANHGFVQIEAQQGALEIPLFQVVVPDFYT
jgi:hypothetical protein